MSGRPPMAGPGPVEGDGGVVSSSSRIGGGGVQCLRPSTFGLSRSLINDCKVWRRLSRLPNPPTASSSKTVPFRQQLKTAPMVTTLQRQEERKSSADQARHGTRWPRIRPNLRKRNAPEYHYEYHYVLTCTALVDQRKKYLKNYYYTRPNTVKFSELFNSKGKQMSRLVTFVKLIMSLFK